MNVVCAQCVAVGERKILTFGNGRASQICQCLRGQQRFKYVCIYKLAWVTEWPTAHLVGCNFEFG